MIQTATRHILATLDGPDSADITNPIHSTEVARQYGFERALVGGVTVYGWATPPIIQTLGETWLSKGWVDVRFKAPVYPGDEIAIQVEAEDRAAAFRFTNQVGTVCLEGTAGLGGAAWAGDIRVPERRMHQDRPATLPRLEPGTLPLGLELRPMRDHPALEEVTTYAHELQRDEHLRWTGPSAVIHPGWIAGRMTRLMHHSFDYGPSIHTRSQIQHLAAIVVGQPAVVAGTFVETFEKNGHNYVVLDGAIFEEGSGDLLVKLRHTTIYRVARKDERGS